MVDHRRTRAPPRRDILVPNIAGRRHETLPVYPEDAAFFNTAPDWICEILSPSTRRQDVTGKPDICGREGVPHLCFVDPDARTLEAFELRDGTWSSLAALAGDATVSLPLFVATSIALSALWPSDPKS